MEKLCTNKNHSYKHNEEINKQNIDNSECCGVKYIKIYLSLSIGLTLLSMIIDNERPGASTHIILKINVMICIYFVLI
jgi:hypothetical protein